MIEIAAAFASVKNNGNLNFAPSSSTTQAVSAGYYTGGSLSTANAVKTLRRVGNISGNGSISCTSVPNYKSLTKSNFLLTYVSGSSTISGKGGLPVGYNSNGTLNYSYNASTGTLSISSGCVWIASDSTAKNTTNIVVTVYCLS